MSSSALAPRESSDPATATLARDCPAKNPSYPPRTHFGEKQALEEKLRSWDEKIAALAVKLSVLGAGPGRASRERLLHQMMGARDQMAEAVRRMPLETGALYEEDAERLRNAEAALVRLVQRWDAVAPELTRLAEALRRHSWRRGAHGNLHDRRIPDRLAGDSLEGAEVELPGAQHRQGVHLHEMIAAGEEEIGQSLLLEGCKRLVDPIVARRCAGRPAGRRRGHREPT